MLQYNILSFSLYRAADKSNVDDVPEEKMMVIHRLPAAVNAGSPSTVPLAVNDRVIVDDRVIVCPVHIYHVIFSDVIPVFCSRRFALYSTWYAVLVLVER